MELSIFIARILGLAYVVVGLGMLFNPKYYAASMKEMVKELGVMYLGGVMALVVGFIWVSYHNVWQGWPILITVFGWLALIKGITLLMFPKLMMKFTNYFFKHASALGWWGFIILVLGLVFSYLGWMM